MRGREDAELQWICRSTLETLSPAFRGVKLEARFYRYIGLTHTIRRKGSTWVIRISDHCRSASAQVLEAIVVLLGCRILRKRTPAKPVEIYENFRKSPFIESAIRERRLAKGRKYMAEKSGTHHSPEKIYHELNSLYFNDQVDIRRIGWSRRISWRRLGHYDPVHRTITISPALDSPKVPDYAIRYIVYHEMLHDVFHDEPTFHPPIFRKTERAYPDFERATKFLRNYCSRRRK
jgi:hypothetical protein